MSTGTINLPVSSSPTVLTIDSTPVFNSVTAGSILFVNSDNTTLTSDSNGDFFFNGGILYVDEIHPGAISTDSINVGYLQVRNFILDESAGLAIGLQGTSRDFFDQNQNLFMSGTDRLLYDRYGIQALDFDQRVFNDASNASVINFQSGVVIYSANANVSADFQNRILTPGSIYNTLSWANGIVITDSNGVDMAEFISPNGPSFFGNLYFQTTGKGLQFKNATNGRVGSLTLNGTTAVVVNNTTITANTLVILTIQTGAGTVGAPYVSARTNGTSFSVKSTIVGDTSTCGYMLVEKF